jgi:hypothetical protein
MYNKALTALKEAQGENLNEGEGGPSELSPRRSVRQGGWTASAVAKGT